jgi:1,4-alpha-glucan branching enzyme
MVYPGVDERFEPGPIDRKAAGVQDMIPEEEPYFLFLGAMIARKNTPFIVQLFSEANKAGLRAHLVLAGEGPELMVVRQLVRKVGLCDRIHLLGAVTREQQLALYRGATAFLFPSLMEGFGFAPAEAMACGTPAIVSNRGSLPEIVDHGVNGFVLPLEDSIQTWTEVLIRLTTNGSLLKQMRLSAAQIIRARFSRAASADSTARSLAQLLERHARNH